MKRVMIIGSPGVGKSVFAVKLAKKTNLALYHLDYFYHDSSKNYQENKDLWRKKVENLTSRDAWIIDGNYGTTMAERTKRSDTIIYFDLPTSVALKGVLRRWVKSERNGMPDEWRERPSWSFLKYVMGFRKTYRQDTLTLLSSNRDKNIVTFKNHSQSEAYLDSI